MKQRQAKHRIIHCMSQLLLKHLCYGWSDKGVPLEEITRPYRTANLCLYPHQQAVLDRIETTPLAGVGLEAYEGTGLGIAALRSMKQG